MYPQGERNRVFLILEENRKKLLKSGRLLVSGVNKSARSFSVQHMLETAPVLLNKSVCVALCLTRCLFLSQ